MKKIYQFPATKFADVLTTVGLLTGSPAVDPAPAPGIGAARSSYDDGGSQTW